MAPLALLPARCVVPSALPARLPTTLRRAPRPSSRSPYPLRATPGDSPDDLSASSAAALRAGPLIAGSLGIAGVLLNRVVGGVAPTIAAGSAQSRADVVAILLSAVLVLTGLQWLTLAPKTPEPVPLGPDATTLDWVSPDLPSSTAAELRWAAGAAGGATRSVALVALDGLTGRCLAHIGAASTACAPGAAAAGPITASALASRAGTYLANLKLYPGGSAEFGRFLPSGTAGVLVAPGSAGRVALILATDTPRGFGRLDQAWAGDLADKVEAGLEEGGWEPDLGSDTPVDRLAAAGERAVAGLADAAGSARFFFGAALSAVSEAKRGGAAPPTAVDTGGVLSEWNQYTATASGPSASDRLLSSVEEGAASARALASSALGKAAAAASAAAGGAAAAGSALVPSPNAVAHFLALLGAGASFLLLAFAIFLPVIVVAPAKFALCFSLGSALVMASVFALRGWAAHAAHVLSADRLPFTATYAASLGVTLYAAIILHSYLLSLAACGVQVAALAYYGASYLPGGTASLRAAGGVAWSAASGALGLRK